MKESIRQRLSGKDLARIRDGQALKKEAAESEILRKAGTYAARRSQLRIFSQSRPSNRVHSRPGV